MGEYATTIAGREVKIGTCESMYYLRADQRHLVRYTFDPGDRFRFPFPDEDGIEPGQFEDYDRGVKIPGWSLPADMEGHGSVQFSAPQGYLCSLDCPEGEHATHVDHAGLVRRRDTTVNGVHVGRNGWNGGPVVKQQKVVDGQLWTVVACGACGAAWRIEDPTSIIEAFRVEAERQEWRRGYDFDRDEFTNDYAWEPANGEAHRVFLNTMADRIEAGYAVTV